MGKGGNATVPSFTNKNDENVLKSTLELERKEKMDISPDFYWADGDSMEEPHVKRYD